MKPKPVSKMRIGLDVSGGDFAPTANLDGVALAMQILDINKGNAMKMYYLCSISIKKELKKKKRLTLDGTN